jgi:4-hydroxy-3-methylbut-2-enyl diphosphate reductase IspH
MEVIVAENCGFCPGVRNAVSMAEKILSVEKQGK